MSSHPSLLPTLETKCVLLQFRVVFERMNLDGEGITVCDPMTQSHRLRSRRSNPLERPGRFSEGGEIGRGSLVVDSRLRVGDMGWWLEEGFLPPVTNPVFRGYGRNS